MIVTLLLVAALVFGIIAIVESNWRSWAGWGVALVAVALLLPKIA